MENGEIKFASDVESAISYYLGGGDAATLNRRIFGKEHQNNIFTLRQISISGAGKTENDPITEDDQIHLKTKIDFHINDANRYNLTFHLYNELGEAMFSFYHSTDDVPLRRGSNNISCSFPKNFFQAGNFNLGLYVVEDKRNCVFIENDIVTFTIADGGRELGVYMGREPGYITPKFIWKNS